MAAKDPQVHRFGLSRIVVEGNRQPIIRVATLTLKDEDPDKHIMQVHVDGSTLAEWDLGTLGERKSTGGEQFFSISEQKMLQFTLPLSEEQGQTIAHGTELKSIQLFLLKFQDFHTAVNYLSQSAGLRHCHLKNVSANIMDADAPWQAQSQPLESYMTSTMESPMGPPRRPRVRPQSQASVFAPARNSASQSIRRPQTARPNSTLVTGNSTHRPSRPGPTVPVGGRVPTSGHPYRQSLPQVPHVTRDVFAPNSLGVSQRFPSRGSGTGSAGDRIPLYEHPMRRASMANHAPSTRPMQYDREEPPPSHSQVEIDTHDIPGGLYDDRWDDQSTNRMGQVSSSTSHTIRMRPSPFDSHLLPRMTQERNLSRALSVSERTAPINIQILGSPDESSISYQIRWEFTLHLLPSTKIYELCLHAASYIRRAYRSTVDGSALAAQSKNGIVFGDQDNLSEEILQGEALLLIERRLLDMVQPVPLNLSGSYPDPWRPDWRPEAGKLEVSHPESSQDLSSQALDEVNRVPPPRQLPFQLVVAPGPSRSSSSTVTAQSPLCERPDLVNTNVRMRASAQPGQPMSEHISTKTATKNQPGSRQRRPRSALGRQVSPASGGKLDLVPATTQQSEPQTLKRRPETSLGIHYKKKAPSSDAVVTAAMTPVTESITSGAEVGKQELATAACMGCRNKKRKCNRTKPACGPCLKDNRPCTYPNIRETKATGSTTDKAYKGHDLETGTHPMVLRRQAVTSLPVMSDALTQTSHSWASRDIDTQTQSDEHVKEDVDMKDVGTDPCSLYTNASTETDRCNGIWLPFAQCAEVMIWAVRRSEEQIQKASDVLKTTDPSREDYRSKVELAAVYAVEFENELRDKCQEVLRG